jgi:hypothetical protein
LTEGRGGGGGWEGVIGEAEGRKSRRGKSKERINEVLGKGTKIKS